MTRQNFSREIQAMLDFLGFFRWIRCLKSNFVVSNTVVKLPDEFTWKFSEFKLEGRTRNNIMMFHVWNQLVGSPSCDASNRTQLAWERLQMVHTLTTSRLLSISHYQQNNHLRGFNLSRTLSLAALDRRSTWNLALAVIKIYELWRFLLR